MIYDDYSLDNLARTVRVAARHIRESEIEYDSICVQGMSGVIVGAPLALRLRKPLVVVRKDGEKRHSHEDVINYLRIGDAWLFVDDFIDSGATLRRVYDRLALYSITRGASWAGSYLYSADEMFMNITDHAVPPHAKDWGDPLMPAPVAEYTAFSLPARKAAFADVLVRDLLYGRPVTLPDGLSLVRETS
jgi:hypothetical protein